MAGGGANAEPKQTGDRAQTGIALPAATAAVLLSQQIGAKAARDAFFLSNHRTQDLPRVMALAAIVSLVVVLGTSRAMTKLGPARVVPAALAINAVALAIMAALLPLNPAIASLLLFFLVAASGAVLVSGFWSLVTERFDPHRARQVVGKIGAGATLGGALGGITADLVVRLTSLRGLLIELACASAVAAFLATRIAKREAGAPRSMAFSSRTATSGPVDILRRTPYLQALAGLALLAAVWASLLDFAFKSRVAGEYPSQHDLVRFFGWFYTATGIITFVAQTFVGDRIVRNKGIGIAVLALPGFVAIFGALVGALDMLVLLVVLRGMESVLANSLHRSSYELFFTPLPPATKRPTKTIVDVAATRLGDALGGLITTVALTIMPTLPARLPIVAAALAGFGALWIATRLGKGYVSALTDALRSGKVDLREADDYDALTRVTLAESTSGIDRARLLTEIEAYRREMLGELEGKRPSIVGRPSLAIRAPTEDNRLATIGDLLSNEEERMGLALGSEPHASLAPLVAELLNHRKLATNAEQALIKMGSPIAGALSDFIMHPSHGRTSRARAARVLAQCGGSRAIAGLIDGLESDAHAVRLACARGLVHVARDTERGAGIPRDTVFVAAAKAIEKPTDPLETSASTAPEHPSENVFGDAEAHASRLDQSVHVSLTLLACVVDIEAISLVVRAIAGSDSKLRGTALEYLENVLPEPSRRTILTKLAHRRAAGKQRSTSELLDALGRSKA